jgi:hypothetical protein
MRNIFNYAIVIVFLLPMLGCGGSVLKTEFIEGTISFQGVPVEGAMLSFSPVNDADGAPASGRTDVRGRYVLQTRFGAVDAGTTPGEYVVTVTKMLEIPTGERVTYPDGTGFEVMRYEQALPGVYGSISTTPLRATVVSGGPNVFDFDLGR